MEKVKNFKYSVSFGLVILAINYVLDYQNMYTRFPIVDIPMHFMGGWAAALFALELKKQVDKSQLHILIEFLYVLGFVSIVTLFWEYYEFFSDSIFKTKYQYGLLDTIKDQGIGILGGISAFFLVGRYSRASIRH